MLNILKLTGPRLEILKDAKGPYGIGFVGDCEQLIAWHVAREGTAYAPPKIIFRPDRIAEDEFRTWAAYQCVFLGPLFKRSAEVEIVNDLLRAMLMRDGLCLPEHEARRLEWWAEDTAQQARNRRTYHGLKMIALRITNSLMREALDTAAPKELLRVARRYPPRDRRPIYEAGARSPRALQLAEVFPVLALAIYGDARRRRHEGSPSAAAAVENGAPLREIADEMQIPMAMKKMLPGPAGFALTGLEVFRERPNLIHAHLPCA